VWKQECFSGKSSHGIIIKIKDKMKMKHTDIKSLLFFAGIVGLISVLLLVLYWGQIKDNNIVTQIFPDRAILHIGEVEINVDIADTDSERTRGLSGREILGPKEGMLFVFDTSRIPHFWMKDMNFALDIIWINEQLEIVGFVENASPESFPKTFSPSLPVKYVLETGGGFVNFNNIKKGDTVQILTP